MARDVSKAKEEKQSLTRAILTLTTVIDDEWED
jgi:hypothetical protein